MSGETVPEYDAPDETVYIPGRNIILITLAAIWCSLNDGPPHRHRLPRRQPLP